MESNASTIRPGAASVVIVKGENVLVIACNNNPDKKKLQLLGGKAKANESTIDTVLREVVEESSLSLDPKKLEHLTQVNYTKGEKTLSHHFFMYRANDNECCETRGKKALEWIPIHNLRNGKLFAWWGYKIPIRAAERLLAAA